MTELLESGRYRVILDMKYVCGFGSASMTSFIDLPQLLNGRSCDKPILRNVHPQIFHMFELLGITRFVEFDIE